MLLAASQLPCSFSSRNRVVAYLFVPSRLLPPSPKLAAGPCSCSRNILALFVHNLLTAFFSRWNIFRVIVSDNGLQIE